MACRPCIGINCDDPDDLASGIDGALYSALDYSFEVDCPTGCFCPPGLFPRTISILASTIPPVVPPITEPGSPIILRLQGCTALITRTLDSTATLDEIKAAAQSMQAEWAGQQALCLATQVPGVNCNIGPSINICNDAQDFICVTSGPVHVDAGVLCQQLFTAGLGQTQIDAATAIIKAQLNNLVRVGVCPIVNKGVCTIVGQFSGLPGSTFIGFTAINNNAVTNIDATQICINLTGPGAPATFCGANPSVTPGNQYSFDIEPGVSSSFTITIGGIVVWTSGIPPSNFNLFITFCGH